MARLETGVKPEVLRKYPHMMPQDSRIWTRYLLSGQGDITEVWYDLHVGDAVTVPEGSPEFMQAVSDGVTKKRIDVVGRVGAGFWVIEIKPICTMASLGQALVYRDLFKREFGGASECIPVVICALIESDIIDSADNSEVLVWSLEGILR